MLNSQTYTLTHDDGTSTLSDTNESAATGVSSAQIVRVIYFQLAQKIVKKPKPIKQR